MKKLLGGVFARAQAAASPSAALVAPDMPTALSRTGGRWSASPPTAAPTATEADQKLLQQLDELLRGLVVHIKAAIAKILEATECDDELRALSQLLAQASDEFQQQSGDLTVDLLKDYFTSLMGVTFCEQTAFPSLVMDFIGKMRRFSMKEHLNDMLRSRNEDNKGNVELHQTKSSKEPVVFSSVVPLLELLMTCVIAITFNETLMETFRCELPNMIELTAEEYPPAAVFIRDCCNRAVINVPKRNFNAGLAWYLLDCNVVAKTVRLMTSFSFATPTTPEKASEALGLYITKPSEHTMHSDSIGGLNDSAAEAAVSEALGLTRNKDFPSERRAITPPASPLTISRYHPEGNTEALGSSANFCLPSYDVRIGLRTIIYILQNTYKFTLALLDEFQATGGYVLLLSLLDTCAEEEIPALLDLLILLIPLGAHSPDNDTERLTSRGAVGARNVNAFAAIRDLLLKYVIETENNVCATKEGGASTQKRNEHLVLQLLTHVLHVYTSDYDNFVFLEPKTHTLALLLTKLPGIIFYDAQVIILRIVEYVCCAAKPDDPLPYEILAIICGLTVEYGSLLRHDKIRGASEVRRDKPTNDVVLTTEELLNAFKENPNLTLLTLMCECLVKILQACESDVFKNELSGFGLLERGAYAWLRQISSSIRSIPEHDVLTRHVITTELKSHLQLYSTMVCLMLRNNTQECVHFRQARIHQFQYDIVEMMLSDDSEDGRTGGGAFSVVGIFIELAAGLRSKSVSSSGRDLTSDFALLHSGVESDLTMILELLQRFRGVVWRQNVLLRVLMAMLKAGGPLLCASWKSCQGYEILVALLSALDFTNSESNDRSFEMIKLAFDILDQTLDVQHGGKQNGEYFKTIDGYSTVASCIINSGVLHSDRVDAILDRVFNLIAGTDPPKEIRNGDAVHIIFRWLPTLVTSDAIGAIKRLQMMIDNAGANNTLSKQEQVGRLVRAGALKWMKDPALLSMISQDNHTMMSFLTKWLLIIATENDLSMSCLQELLSLLGEAMPKLLDKHWYPCNNATLEVESDVQSPEIGLQLLETILRNPAIRHTPVGKPQGTEQIGRYVHIVNSADRVWPPSAGYSFSCWLRLPPTTMAKYVERRSHGGPPTTPATLCEGYIVVTSSDNNVAPTNAYGVLVGNMLTLFQSSECGRNDEDVLDAFEVELADRPNPIDIIIKARGKSIQVSCGDVETTEMWWRAVKRHGINKLPALGNSASDPLSDDNLLASFGNTTDAGVRAVPSATEAEEGSACILSMYSLESLGCFVRVFFEQSTGLLRFHTGSANVGSTMNAKRTSVVFEDVAIDDLRPICTSSGEVSTGEKPASPSDSSFSEPTERKRDWHHFAFTHRKAMVGSSLITVYIDGQEIATKKLNFPSLPAAGSFQAFVGSDTQVCSPHSALSWEIGPAWLVDDIIAGNSIAAMFSLGPTFSDQFSGHSYRPAGNWPEALASSHLTRAADRGIEIEDFARRLQLTKLSRSCQRQWRGGNESTTGNVNQSVNSDSVGVSTGSLAESMLAKKDGLAEGFRLAAGGGGMSAKKEKNKVAAFRDFINYDCAPSTFGSEIEFLLGSCKLAEEDVLFTLNTSHSDQADAPLMTYIQVHYINCEQSNQLDLARSLPSVGGISQVLLPLLDNSWRHCDFAIVIKMLVSVLRRNPACLAECFGMGNYALLASIFCTRADLIDEETLTCVVQLAISGKLTPYATPHVGSSIATRLAHPVVVDSIALSQVVLNCEFRKNLPHHLQCQLVSLLMDLLVDSNPNALFNARQLRRAGLLRWIITYLSELGNQKCNLDAGTALEMKWCFPKFSESTFEAILQYALSLLRAFLRMESHVDDFHDIAEVLLVSLSSDVMHTRHNPIRLILIQFVLHEIEHDASLAVVTASGGHNVQGISVTIVDAVLHREQSFPRAKKREDKRKENTQSFEQASLGSPLAESLKTSAKFGKDTRSQHSADNFATVLLEVINQTADDGPWVFMESLLATRVLMLLAQMHSNFGEHLICRNTLKRTLRRVLVKHSTNCSIFIPLLSYVSNIAINDTVYYDPDTLSTTEAGPQTFSLPAPSSLVLSNPKCIDHVWDLIGDLMRQNCHLGYNKMAREVNVVILDKIAFQVRTSSAFFGLVCKSSDTLLRIIAHCLLSHPDDDTEVAEGEVSHGSLLGERYDDLTQAIVTLEHGSRHTSDACLDVIRATMVRALAESDEFASLMMHFLNCLGDYISKQTGQRLMLSQKGGQEFWLALLKHIIESEGSMTDNGTLTSVKNVCTVSVALSRYLADETNHHIQKHKNKSSGSDEQATADVTITPVTHTSSADKNVPVECFGEKVFFFLLHCCETLSTSNIGQIIGVDRHQFFIGSMIFGLQTIILNEFGGAHHDTPPSLSLLNCTIKSKAILFQQPTWQAVILCGVPFQGSVGDTGESEAGGPAASGKAVRRMNRIRSLSSNSLDEFGVGAESDRSCILSFAAQLFSMLMDDSREVRHAAIQLWQFLIDQRFDVIKDLLIAEPRTSLLHSISTTKKDTVVDVFHGGFDRLLFAHAVSSNNDSSANGDALLNQEVWCQFQLWLTENISMLTELIVGRADTIHRHIMDVLMACSYMQKLSDNDVSRDTCLDTNFHAKLDVRIGNAADDSFELTDNAMDGREIIVNRALLKFSSFRDSALDSMADGVSRWKATSLRHSYTRNIWRTGKWQTEASSNIDPSDLGSTALQLSMFQRKSLRYCLDNTEGPQRMRLRLMHDYSAEHESHPEGNPSQSYGDAVENDNKGRTQTSPRVETSKNEAFQKSLEFHDAVDVFREAVYLSRTSSTVQSVLSRCKMESTRKLFSQLNDDDNEIDDEAQQIITMARKVYRFFLEGEANADAKQVLGVSPSIIADIDRSINFGTEKPEEYPIPSTLFDAADAEATQYALFTVRHDSSRSIAQTIGSLEDTTGGLKEDSDDEIDEDIVGTADCIDRADSDDEEVTDSVDANHSVPSNSVNVDPTEPISTDNFVSSTPEATSPKSDLNQGSKRVDTSSDAMYGSIARFLQRDDYPPIRSYNSKHIVGMGGTLGILVLSQFGLYFIGGYARVCNLEDGDLEENAFPSRKSPDLTTEAESNQSTTQNETPKSAKRKTTKALFKAALADLSMQFVQPKGVDQSFTVVPLPAQIGSTAASLSNSSTNSRWNIKYSSVRQFRRIKYQLRPVGIEFFDTDGSTYFVQLESYADREEIVKLLFQMPLVNSIFWTPVLRTGALVPSIKKIRHALTKRWLRGTMSNFEYLIHLNTLAGRSFNDITQYPVFPWVIADYDSEFLDLDATNTFRDLSKPMGAIGESRAMQFCERYAALSQDGDAEGPMGTPAFHYGTHYSCSAYVVNYLIRLEPFTALALELQGGEFDHPDRLFRSIPSSWKSASKENLQDVRELIPEFFYLPEFLYNANNCDFGTTQSGEDVCHVALPRWAHGDPREFVRLHRQALECKHVSEHLHEWIDLVFGAKQTGKAAVKAQNVFMHITYEGTVDIEQITDPVMRAATVSQIENFGQTPSRLFSSPHPQRKVPTLLTSQNVSVVSADSDSQPISSQAASHVHDGHTLNSVEAYVKWHIPLAPALVSIGKDYIYLKKHSVITALNGSSVGELKLINDKMQCVRMGCSFVPPRFVKYLDWGNQGGVMKLRVQQQSSGAGRYREANKVLAVIEGAHHDLVNCATLSDDGMLLVTGGQDAVVNLIECSKSHDGRRVFKQISKLVGHSDSVTCVAINKEFNLIVSSSMDCSALLWDLRTHTLLQELTGHSAAVTHASINSSNGNILTTTGSELRVWSINGDLLAASSSTAFGLQNITTAISTRCESWQSGVVAVTGHANGAIALWGLRYPADLARQKKEMEEADAASQVLQQSLSASSTLPSSPRRMEPFNTAVSISSHTSPASSRRLVAPSCQLFVLKLLLDHRVRVTALTLGPEQRQLLSGDAEGNCIRWMDDSISTNMH